MEKKQRNKALFCSIIMVLMLIVVTSSTVAFFVAGANDNETIVGEAANIDFGLTVSAMTDITKGLIPIKETDITKGLKGEKGTCIDANGNTVCQIYKLNVKNNGDSAVSVNGEVALSPEAGLTNLRWALLTNDMLQIEGETKETSNVSLVSNDAIALNGNKDYYIVIYLQDSSDKQDSEQGKKFTGAVTFYAAGGTAEGISASFGGATETQERSSEEMLTYLGLTAKSGTPNFSKVATTDEGIYSAEDDYGTSYYFRGAVTNNYVKFAGTYWRIIRINGDGTIRMVYDGTSKHKNGESSEDRQLASKSKFNTNYNDNAYVGFMYGNTGQSGDNAYTNTHANTNSSTIKRVLDTWYGKISEENQGYIADSIFCGDRTVYNDTDDYTGDGTGTTKTSYGRYRLKSNKSPQLICPNKNDKYTVSDTEKGNKALTNPVGLITADEVAMAGGVYNTTNTSYYLYTGQDYWTMSPSSFNGFSANVFGVYSNGALGGCTVSNSYRVRPVINLKSDITFSDGNGSYDTPWIVGTGEA